MSSLFLFTPTRIILAGAGSAFIAVAMGAFGAHGLRDLLSSDYLAVFETGVRYQFYHSFALLFVGLIGLVKGSHPWLRWVGMVFTLGIVLFSGSLYVLAMTQWHMLGIITPFGGILFLVGWLLLGWYCVKL